MSDFSGESYISFGTATGYVAIAHYDSGLHFCVGHESGALIIPFNSNYLNKWTHYVLSYKNGIIEAYINGALVGSIAQTKSISFDAAAIGRHWWYDGTISSTRLIGSINQVRIYNRALTEQEIQTLYNESGWSGYSGKFIDSRDSHPYNWVRIGNQIWMAENLAYLPAVNPLSSESYTEPSYYVYDYSGTDVALAKENTNYTTYGALYNWPAALIACPPGWHLPSDDELRQLEMALGMTQAQADATGWRGTDQGTQLKATSGWNNNGSGTNTSGFKALPSGNRSHNGVFADIGNTGTWWSSIENGATKSCSRALNNINNNVNKYSDYKVDGFSVRCVKDDPNTTTATVTTNPVSVFTSSTATVGGVVTADGGSEVIERGVFWGKEPNPEKIGEKQVIGKGNGSFSVQLSNLDAETSNYVKAYAINGSGMAIGSEVSFTTLNFWAGHTKGGIAVQVIETGEKGVVKYVGFEYNEVITKDFAGNETLISKTQKFPLVNAQSFLTNFPKGSKINTRFNNEILLFDKDEKQIGHITFNYNPDFELGKCRNTILFLHNDDNMCKEGNITLFPFSPQNPRYPKWYQEGWRYFTKGEFPVSMLIPPYDKMAQTMNKEPLLFAHGWEGTYPYWKDKNKTDSSTVDLVNAKGNFDAWQVYYPGNMDIVHSSLCLKNDLEYLSETFYNKGKVNIVTHSMGGLVTSEFVTSHPFIAGMYVEKILMTVPPIHGSLGANTFYKTFSGGLTEEIVGADNEAPCVMDMSLGSTFVTNLHQRKWDECFDFNLNGKISDDVFVLLGTTKQGFLTGFSDWIKRNFAEEALNHHDIIVAISSGSLLDHLIGFATMFGNHDDGKFNSNMDKNFLPDFINTYFTVANYEVFTDAIANNNNIKTIVNPDKTVIKPSEQNLTNLKTDENNVDYQKGIMALDIPESKINSYFVYLDENRNSIGLSYFSKDSYKEDLSWFKDRTSVGYFKRNKYSGKFYFNGQTEQFVDYGCAIKLQTGNYKISFHPSLGINLSGSIDFNNCQTSYETLETNNLAQNNNGQSYYKTGYLSYVPLTKKAAIGFAQLNEVNDTTIFVDDQVQAVNFTLQSWEANKNKVPITMKLKMPDGTVIDPTSPGITFSIDSITGLHQMLVNNPMTGKWHIWAETNQPGTDAMQYVARAYFLSDIVAYNASDTDKVIEGNRFKMKAGLKFNNLNLLDTASMKVMAMVTAPNGEKQVCDISKKISQTDTSFIFSILIPTDTMGYYTVEVTFNGTYNGFKFERALVFQFESLDSKVYFNLPYVELNENKRFTELQLSKFVQSYANKYDTVHFTQRIISSSVDTSAYKVILDSLQRNAIIYSSISDTGMVKIEYAFSPVKDSVMKDTMQVFINQIYPHPVLTPSTEELCLGSSVTLMAAGGDTIKWSTGESTSSIIVNPTVTTLYKVTVGRNGYIAYDSIKVNVITSPEAAGLIAGDTTVTQGDSKVVYKVPKINGATTYEWTIPTGATGTSTVDTINVDFGLNAFSGEIKVKGKNKCGEGDESTFMVFVKPIIIKQKFIFKSGWNIFSSPILPDSTNLKTIFKPLIDNNSIIKIQDEAGNSIEDWGIFGGWQNNIGNISPTEGYKVKVNTNDTLAVTGYSVQYPFAIPLKTGWNIAGYPQQTDFGGMNLVQQLLVKGTLIKVQDEAGNSIEDWGIFGGWTNGIGDFVPGEGYKIKVSAKDTLWIYDSYQKSSAILPKLDATTYFQPEFEGNGVDHMNINLVGLPINLLKTGDELAIYDGTTCVGAVRLMPHNLISQTVAIAASATDNQGMAGFAEGNPIMLKLWNSRSNQEFNLEPEIVKGTPTFTKHETTVASLEKYSITGLEGISGSNLTEINCYPNPFSDKVTVEINLAANAQVQVEVLNQLGQRVKMITTKQMLPGGLHKLDWDGKNTGNQQVAQGIYHLLVNIDGKDIHKKIVYSK